jgi:hypothetical protein
MGTFYLDFRVLKHVKFITMTSNREANEKNLGTCAYLIVVTLFFIFHTHKIKFFIAAYYLDEIERADIEYSTFISMNIIVFEGF